MSLSLNEAGAGPLPGFAIEAALGEETGLEVLNLDSVLDLSLAEAWEAETVNQDINRIVLETIDETKLKWDEFIEETYQRKNIGQNRSTKRTNGDIDANFLSQVKHIFSRIRAAVFLGDSVEDSLESLKAHWHARVTTEEDPVKE